MSAELTSRGFDLIARKWCDLAERRRAYYVELYQSGRWQRYYSVDQFRARMRDVVQAAKKWDELAGGTQPAGSDIRSAA